MADQNFGCIFHQSNIVKVLLQIDSTVTLGNGAEAPWVQGLFLSCSWLYHYNSSCKRKLQGRENTGPFLRLWDSLRFPFIISIISHWPPWAHSLQNYLLPEEHLPPVLPFFPFFLVPNMRNRQQFLPSGSERGIWHFTKLLLLSRKWLSGAWLGVTFTCMKFDFNEVLCVNSSENR